MCTWVIVTVTTFNFTWKPRYIEVLKVRSYGRLFTDGRHGRRKFFWPQWPPIVLLCIQFSKQASGLQLCYCQNQNCALHWVAWDVRKSAQIAKRPPWVWWNHLERTATAFYWPGCARIWFAEFHGVTSRTEGYSGRIFSLQFIFFLQIFSCIYVVTHARLH